MIEHSVSFIVLPNNTPLPTTTRWYSSQVEELAIEMFGKTGWDNMKSLGYYIHSGFLQYNDD